MSGVTLAIIMVLGGDLTARCDLLEVNHVCRADGSIVFTQVIAWEWLPDYAVYRAQDWKIVREWYVHRDALTAWDTSDTWRARFNLFRETWTPFDAETRDRKSFPTDYRVDVFCK